MYKGNKSVSDGFDIFVYMKNILLVCLMLVCIYGYSQEKISFFKKKESNKIDVTFKIGNRSLTKIGDDYTMLELSRLKYGDRSLALTSTNSFFSGAISSAEFGIQKAMKKGVSIRSHVGIVRMQQSMNAEIKVAGRTSEKYFYEHRQSFIYAGINVGYDLLDKLIDLDINAIIYGGINARFTAQEELNGIVFILSNSNWTTYGSEDILPAFNYGNDKMYIDPHIGIKLEFIHLFFDLGFQTFNKNYLKFGSRGSEEMMERHTSFNYAIGLSF